MNRIELEVLPHWHRGFFPGQVYPRLREICGPGNYTNVMRKIKHNVSGSTFHVKRLVEEEMWEIT